MVKKTKSLSYFQTAIMKAITGRKLHGAINDEVVNRLVKSGWAFDTALGVHRRFKELYLKKLIRYTGETRRGRSGRQQRVMMASALYK